MSIIQKTKRRNFLKAGVGGAAALAVPYIWVPRLSRAATQVPADPDNHLILFNLDGGCRSVPMWNGGVDSRYNPYGMHDIPTIEWGLGSVFDNQQYTDTTALGMTPVPSIGEIANDIAVLGTVDHTPGSASSVGNHNTARNWIATGTEGNGPGWVSRIYGRHKKYVAGAGGLAFPPVIIGSGNATTPLGNPEGSISAVMTPSHEEFAEQSGDNGGGQPQWARVFEAGLDKAMSDARSAADRQVVARMSNGKENVEAFRNVFLDPSIKVATEPTGTLNELTNQQLQAIFGTTLLARDTALALRFVGYGATAVVVGNNGWDTHSNEEQMYRDMANDVARMYAGLNYALKLMPHPKGGTYWDRTIVGVISEFGRDNLMSSGYNSGMGSDHQGTDGSRYQAYPMMGGPITQGGKLFGATMPTTMEAAAGTPVYSTTDYLATLMAFLDIDYGKLWNGVTPIAEIF